MKILDAEHPRRISISIVSHGQIYLINNLLNDIHKYCQNSSLELILTRNIEETLPFDVDSFLFPIKLIENPAPNGFGTNHNHAFAQATGQYFCVMNPDIRLYDDPFPALIECLKQPLVGVVAPLVVGNSGNVEDSARFFPTPFKILCKVFGGGKGSDYVIEGQVIYPDWVGGMFMLFPREIFENLTGFNEQFFLYYEDVDLCARLRLQGYEVVLCPVAKVIHDAQRTSHKSLKYFKWHFISMLHFFCSLVFLQIFWQKLIRVKIK
jgi:N-acetylglucosaminyl-diphospho-decaprenol L-rhamnosyltransferase